MDQELLAELLQSAAKAAESLKPFLSKKIAMFRSAKATAKQRKPTGGLTPKANQALQLLRNPIFGSAHAAKAKGAAAATVKKTGDFFTKSLMETCSQWILFEQAKLELSLFDDSTPGDHQSREDGPIENKKDLIRFHNAMKARDVPMYALARLPEYKLDYIAKLGIDGSEDRDHEDPENRWVKMFTNGDLDCVRGSMSDDEARLLAEAGTTLQTPENLVLRDRLEERLGRTLEVTTGFAASLQRILDEARELTPGEAHIIFFANGQQFSKQTDMLTRLLGLSSTEKSQVEAFVQFVHKAGHVLRGPIVDLRFGRVKDMLARIVETFEDHKFRIRSGFREFITLFWMKVASSTKTFRMPRLFGPYWPPSWRKVKPTNCSRRSRKASRKKCCVAINAVTVIIMTDWACPTT